MENKLKEIFYNFLNFKSFNENILSFLFTIVIGLISIKMVLSDQKEKLQKIKIPNSDYYDDISERDSFLSISTKSSDSFSSISSNTTLFSVFQSSSEPSDPLVSSDYDLSNISNFSESSFISIFSEYSEYSENTN